MVFFKEEIASNFRSKLISNLAFNKKESSSHLFWQGIFQGAQWLLRSCHEQRVAEQMKTCRADYRETLLLLDEMLRVVYSTKLFYLNTHNRGVIYSTVLICLINQFMN